MGKVLFRGISNVCQLVNILNRQTAGGWEQEKISFKELLERNPEIKQYMSHQTGSGGEGYPRIVCIDDTMQDNRCVIEYTDNWRVAARFSVGGIGFIGIKIEDKYVEDREIVGSEHGIYCVSSAPIEICGICIFEDFQDKCPILGKELLEKYKTIVEFAPRNSHSLPKLVMNCVKCNFK